MAILQFRKAPPGGVLMLCALSMLCACSRPGTPIEIDFLSRYGDHTISCTEAAEGLQLTDLRLYVYDLELTDAAGKEHAVELADDGVWQDGAVALLDLENGEGACSNGSGTRNETLRGTVPGVAQGGPFRDISFTVGVPPQSNHRDPLSAGPPLNYTAMHWHWLSGYKFMRVGIGNASDHFWMHLGSSHCDGSLTDGIQCRTANRVRVTLPDFDPGKDRVVIDLERLTEGIDLGDGIGSDCSSGPDELACDPAFRALGLPFGEAADAPPQRVFRGEPAP